ncbi:hypothetical protein SUDANB121_01765 [Nocardiopsis dassonvillei]|uniref:hypothetical protein n=1 Tax=Nocardiopsis dassonvillei TaxID=2014 RepID=UPI003F547A80
MVTPRRTAAALAAAALTLTLAACSGSPGSPADGPGSGEAPLGRDGVPEPLFTGPGPDAGGEPASPTVADTAPPGDGTWILTRVGQASVAAGVEPLRRTEGGFVELTLTFQVQEGSITLGDLLGREEAGIPGDLAGVDLMDLENGRVHRVARDAGDVCVCSRFDPAMELWASDAVTVGGTYAAPPAGVDSMTVRLPFGEVLAEVPVVRG